MMIPITSWRDRIGDQMPREKLIERGWRDWYQLARWRKIRNHQLRTEPLCIACLKKGVIREARIADHIEHHDGNWNKFICGKLQSLCDEHHREKHRDARYGPKLQFGLDGWPIETGTSPISSVAPP